MKILFVCTHNRCRSILFEALANFRGSKYLQARSAGSTPADQVHPLTLKFLAEAGVSTDGLCCSGWGDISEFEPDLVVTVCDSAAAERCPLTLASIPSVHWGLKDPSRITGGSEEMARAFRYAIAEIKSRVDALLEFPLDDMDGQVLAQEIRRYAS